MADKPITVQYEGIDILYLEGENQWHFTLRGRERDCDSLAKAKEAIDKPVPEEKKKGFAPTLAYKGETWYGTNWAKVTVTSIADKGYHSTPQLWINDSKGGRSKKDSSCICAFSDGNTKLIAKMDAITKQIDSLEEKRKDLSQSMEKFIVPSVE